MGEAADSVPAMVSMQRRIVSRGPDECLDTIVVARRQMEIESRQREPPEI